MTLSIVTASMNRTAHLIECTNAAAKCSLHVEHIIVDWSSKPQVNRCELSDDPRIKLIRVEGEHNWNLGRAYNFGFSRSKGDFVLKLDADQILTSNFFLDNKFDIDAFLANDNSVGDQFFPSSTGLFFAPIVKINQIGGFNELLRGWGYDDVDLFARMRGVSRQLPLCTEGCIAINHDDHERIANNRDILRDKLPDALRKSISNARNRWLAQSLIWNSTIQRSTYHHDGGVWRADYIPNLPDEMKRKEEIMAKKIALEVLLRMPLEISDSQKISRVHDFFMLSNRSRIGSAMSILPRLYARAVNWFLQRIVR